MSLIRAFMDIASRVARRRAEDTRHADCSVKRPSQFSVENILTYRTVCRNTGITSRAEGGTARRVTWRDRSVQTGRGAAANPGDPLARVARLVSFVSERHDNGVGVVEEVD